MATLTLNVNGAERKAESSADATLLSFLRDRLGLTGTKYGCGEGQCGACTVLLDGLPVRSCSVPAASAAGTKVVTIEGLEKDGRLHPVQKAFLEEEAFQCAYCTSGMIMSACRLLTVNPRPTDADILNHMDGNICRCGTHPRIVAAIKRAAGMKPPSGASPKAPARLHKDAASLLVPSLVSLAAAASLAVNSSVDDHELAEHEVERLPHFFDVNRRDLFQLLWAGLIVGRVFTP